MKISSFKKLECGVENSYLEYRMCKLEGKIEVFHFSHLVLQGSVCARGSRLLPGHTASQSAACE